MWDPELILDQAPLPGTLVDNRTNSQWIRGGNSHNQYDFPPRTLRPIEATRTPSEANPFFRYTKTGQGGDTPVTNRKDGGDIRHLMATVENTLRDREVPRHIRQTVADLATLCQTLLYGSDASLPNEQAIPVHPQTDLKASSRDPRASPATRQPADPSSHRRRSAAASLTSSARRRSPTQSQLIQEMSETITQKVLENIRRELFNNPLERPSSPCEASQSSIGDTDRGNNGNKPGRFGSVRRQSKQLHPDYPTQCRQGMWRPMPRSTFDDNVSQDASVATVHQDSQDYNCNSENLEVRRLRMMLNKPHLTQTVKKVGPVPLENLSSRGKGCEAFADFMTPGRGSPLPPTRMGIPFSNSTAEVWDPHQMCSVGRGSRSMQSDKPGGSHPYDRNPESSSEERVSSLQQGPQPEVSTPQAPTRVGSPQAKPLNSATGAVNGGYPLNVVRCSSQPPVTARSAMMSPTRYVDVNANTPSAASTTDRELFPRENKSWSKNLQAEKEVFAAALKPPFKSGACAASSNSGANNREVKEKEKEKEKTKGGAPKKPVIDRQVLHTLRIDTLMSNGQGPKTREIDVVRVHCDPDLIVVPKLLTKAESAHMGRLASVDRMSTVQSFPTLLSILSGRNGARVEHIEAMKVNEKTSTCVGRVSRRIAAVSQVRLENLEGLFLVKLPQSSFSDCTWRLKNQMSCILYIFLNELGNNGGEACALGLRVRSQLGTGLLWKDQACVVSEKSREETKLVLVAVFSTKQSSS